MFPVIQGWLWGWWQGGVRVDPFAGRARQIVTGARPGPQLVAGARATAQVVTGARATAQVVTGGRG
jgi:hypothetical protein